MPKVILVVSDEQKALWVEAAHAERLTLSEWIRRRCDGGLAAGEQPGATEQSHSKAESMVATDRDLPPAREASGDSSPAPAASPTEQQLLLRSVDDPLGPGKPLPELDPTPPARSVPQFRTDPKEKAAQEHAPKERQRASRAMCEHRVPAGMYCKKCA